MTSPKQPIDTHRVPDVASPIRLQDYAVGIFDQVPTRKGIKKAIKKGLVHVNSEKGFTGTYIRGGELLELYPDVSTHKPVISLALQVLFEDDHLAVIHKPAGILVSGRKRFTVENALAHNLTKSRATDAMAHPLPVHRLDYPTTGALLIAKTASCLRALKTDFEQQRITKEYIAVVSGYPARQGRINVCVDDKESLSEFNRLAFVNSEKYQRLNLLQLHPHTGRRHQLRQHLSRIGCPIFGDLKYGKQGMISRSNGLYLHAASLEFTHPVGNSTIVVKAPWPKKFVKLFPESQY